MTELSPAAQAGGDRGGDERGERSRRRSCFSAARPLLPVVGVSIAMERERQQSDSHNHSIYTCYRERGCQQNDGLADG